MVNLGDYMFSAVGYGEYGEESALEQGLKFLNKAAGVVGGASAAILFEPIEIQTPEEVKGAKLSRAFKIEKRGEEFHIVIDMDAANRLIPGGIPTPIRSVIGGFTGRKIPDISKDFEVALAPLGTIKYTAPAPNPMMYIAAAVGAIVVIGLALKLKG